MGKPCNRKNVDYALAERRKRVAALYVKGASQWEIARQLKVSQSAICNDLKVIRKKWLASTLRDFDDKKSEELAKLDAVEAEAWEAWRESCTAAATTQTETARVAAKPPKSKSKAKSKGMNPPMIPVKEVTRQTVRERSGDVRFLEVIARTVETRMKVIGLLKGSEVNVTQTQATLQIDWAAMFTDHRADMTTPPPGMDPLEAYALGYTSQVPTTPVIVQQPREPSVGPKSDAQILEQELRERIARLEARGLPTLNGTNGNGAHHE